jgi:membrane-bound lytic murein transglycosylase D
MRKVLFILSVFCFIGSNASGNENVEVSISPKGDTINIRLASPYSNDLKIFDENRLTVSADEFVPKMSSLEYEIPMDFNDEVAHYIDVFATSWQSKLKEVITLSEVYFPIYEELLDREGVPTEIKYLSVIESALNPVAVSRAGAVGTWQFMPATGKLYGLKVNGQIDERSDVVQSTIAGSHYLKSMYEKYGDWLVALASYNCGPGNINRAVRRSGGKTTFWEIYPFLPRQTQNYVPKFIAMAYLMNFYDDHGIKPAVPTVRSEFAKVQVSKEHSFEAIRDHLNIDEYTFRFLNKQFKADRVPSHMDWISLWLPADKAKKFIDEEEVILALSASDEYQIKTVTVVVKRGESLPVIARRNNCTVTQLKHWNNLKGNVIHPGQKLTVHL